MVPHRVNFLAKVLEDNMVFMDQGLAMCSYPSRANIQHDDGYRGILFAMGRGAGIKRLEFFLIFI